MHCSLCCGGGGDDASGDWTQYCNLHCVMVVVVVVFFLKQWCMYGMHALQLVLWWWWCLNVHGIVAVHVWCAWWWLQAVAMCGVCTWYNGCMVWQW